MSQGLVCDRCGALFTKKLSEMNEIKISPYCGLLSLSKSQTKCFDLCKDCTETVMQYINNDVQMVIFNDSKATNEADDGRG